MASVSLTNVQKTFPGRVQAVKDLTLSVDDGAFVVLVGPSGCGKSTILRLVAGLEQPTAGSIAIGDRDVSGIAPKDRDVAMVFQNYALYPHMTVFKNMAFALRMRSVPRGEIDKRVRETAELLGITSLLDRKPKALSGGQQQRVAVGRAIVREPACFLFDEPLSNLDARLRVQMRAEMKQLHQRLRTTTLYVTHDQEEAMTLGDRVVVMRDGEIQQIGPALGVYRKPANSFVAGFIGSPPMNLLPGRLDRSDGQAWFDDGQGIRIALDEPLPAGAEQVVLGVRPEAVGRQTASPDSGSVLQVVVCEPVGDRMDVHLKSSGGRSFLARIPADETTRPGDQFALKIDPHDVHLFEPGPTGRRIN